MARKNKVPMPTKVSHHPHCAMLTAVRVTSQECRADAGKRIGVSWNTLRNWESGTMNPFFMCEAWANALGYEVVLLPRSVTSHVKLEAATNTEPTLPKK